METWLEFYGRLHPLLLHAPIGLLIALFALESWTLLRGKELEHALRRFLISLTAFAVIVTASSGWFLAEEQGFTSDTFWWHRLLGIALAVIVVLAALSVVLNRPRAYGVLLALATIVVVPAGHNGAELTHGADFLTEPFEEAGARAEVVEPPPLETLEEENEVPEGETPVSSVFWFDAGIAPMLAELCWKCHGTKRQRGELAMHEPAALMAGGESGPSLVPGDAAASLLIQRLRLPLEHDDHMPPESKPQPSEAEIAAIEQWIAAGASFDAPLPADFVPPSPAPGEEEGNEEEGETQAPDEPAAADTPSETASLPATPPDAVIAALTSRQVHVETVDPTTGLLWIDFRARTTTDDAFVREHLVPLSAFVVELSLARTQIGDATLELVEGMPALDTLDLTATACTSAGLVSLADHAKLRVLNLTGTEVDDTCVETLLRLPALQRVQLWNSAVTATGIEALVSARPELWIEAGSPPPTDPLETEAPIELTRIPSLDPVNTTCPVSGNPIDPAFRIVFEGRVVAFCCEKCPGQFWADPEKFAPGE